MKRIATRDVPQANKLDKVCDLLALLSVGISDKKYIGQQLRLVGREIAYYKRAIEILGFAESSGRGLVLTETGRRFAEMKTPVEKEAILAQAVRSAAVFRELLRQYDESALDRQRIAKFLRQCTDLKGTTPPRRADTMLAWLKATSASSGASSLKGTP